MNLGSYIGDVWQNGSGAGQSFVNPVSGEVLGFVDDDEIDTVKALEYARTVGFAELSDLSFRQRGAVLNSVAECLIKGKEAYYEIACRNGGNTKIDASIDVDSAIQTLKFYSKLATNLEDSCRILEPNSDFLSRDVDFKGYHIWSSRTGVAVHINAFNFPAWSLWEKVSVAMLAGIPSISKPATATGWLAYEMIRDVVEANLLPKGSLSLICGSGEKILKALTEFDCISFTGSSETSKQIRSHPKVIQVSPRINVEADSVNSSILGPDVLPGSRLFDAFVDEVVKALSIKAGQFCTNIRRVHAPTEVCKDLEDAIVSKLENLIVGDPKIDTVNVGPLVNKTQQQTALMGLGLLAEETKTQFGGGIPKFLEGCHSEEGSFLEPTLLHCSDPSSARFSHELEVFGPVSTVMPYKNETEAVDAIRKNCGALVLSVFTADTGFSGRIIENLAFNHGRILIVDESLQDDHSGHAIPLPQCTHGGPGRAGDGQELGGLRGLSFYMQRTSIQCSSNLMRNWSKNIALENF